MIGGRHRSLTLGAAIVLAATAAWAHTSPDQPAAIVVYPYVTVDPAAGTDTQIQLTNTTDQLAGVRCFYERIELECVGGEEGESCKPGEFTCTGACVIEPRRTEFSFRITAHQPLAWSASEGLNAFPLDGTGQTGPGGQTNGSGGIPALGPGPITVSLRCAAVDAESMLPVADDALVGLATLRTRQGFPTPATDAAQYRAIGIRSLDAELNSTIALRLGGPQGDYEPCSNVEMLEHYFSGAPLSVGDQTALVDTTLVLASCSSAPKATFNSVAQFLVYNEFDQRFSTSRSVAGYLVTPLATIDTPQPERSIFSVNVQGTLAGRTQIASIGNGLHAMAIETHSRRGIDLVHSDGLELHGVGNRADGDVIVLAPPPCAGDCDDDNDVVISEIVTGVGIGLGQIPLDRCKRIDTNDDNQVGINEMVSSVGSSIVGCPAEEPTPKVSPTPTATPSTPPAGPEPEVSHFGLATADDQPLTPDDTDDEGRPVFVRSFGQGFTLIIEGRPGVTGRAIAGSTYSDVGNAPDLQILASKPLGNGGEEVCEQDGMRGGVPAVPDLDFSLDDPATIAAINDLGCRAYERMATPSTTCTRATEPRGTTTSIFANVNPDSTLQFCIPIARAWALPLGETIFAARVRDQSGTFSAPQEIVVRVTGD